MMPLVCLLLTFHVKRTERIVTLSIETSGVAELGGETAEGRIVLLLYCSRYDSCALVPLRMGKRT